MAAAGQEAALDTLKRWNSAIRAKDIDALAALMTGDILIELPFSESGRTDHGCFRVYRGKAQCLDFWREAFAAEGKVNRSADVEVSIAEGGSRIFVEFHGDVTMRSGRAYRNRYVMRFDLVEGRIARCREYYNPIQSAYAFGRLVAGQFRIERL